MRASLLVGLVVAASLLVAGRGVDLLDLPTRAGSFARGPRPTDPNAHACVKVPVPPVHITDDPPPFGAIVQEWELEMSGPYSGAGITWRQDSGRFYLVDQGYMGQRGVWSCDPFDPPGTLRWETWVLPNMGDTTRDIPWGIAWDSDSGCFWISDIVDGNIFGLCYYIRIRKTPVGDTWRWFSENPGDTWLVGNGSAGGAGHMYWMAGSEKWVDRGYFCCAPVAPSPNTNNYVWKFDPYTKTSLGRCPNGDSVSERGLTLVPYDSNYILTAGWSDPWLVKRDTTGFPLQRANGQEISDIALWVPQVIGPDDTVFMYSIYNLSSNILQKRSAGLLWRQLPSVHPFNVRPLSILAPSGSLDSGQAVIPRLVVGNTGKAPAHGVNAYFTINTDGVPVYTDSITGMFLGIGATETLAFTGWTPCGRDTMSVTAWTYWQGDSFPKDDTIRNRFLVRVKDIAVTEIVTPAPDTAVDSGAVFAPQCRVWNYGNVPLGFDVQFRIGAYQAACSTHLIPRGAKLVTAPTSYTAMPGVRTCWASAVVVGDLHPENNTKADTFIVRGTIAKDVDARAVLAPSGLVDTIQAVTPEARFGNNGVSVAFFWTFFSIFGSGGSNVYTESFPAIARPGDSADIEYPDIRFTVMGQYTAACSVYMDGDQNVTNDVKLDTFEVAATGVAEAPSVPLRYGLSAITNPCRGLMTICFNSPLPAPYSLRLYDATGRLVHSSLGLRTPTFRLDLRAKPVGVYVLRLNAGTFTCSQKMILQH